LEKSNLVPFLREGLDILFIGLNPALGSSRNRRYFSVNQSFWSQLYSSGLITQYVDKSEADGKIFGSTEYNFNNWEYGMSRARLIPQCGVKLIPHFYRLQF
jgi:hypothetical protein